MLCSLRRILFILITLTTLTTLITLFTFTKVKAENIYVFISFSMPDNLLKEYIQEIMKYPNGVLVLRGIIDNDYTKTAIKLNKINNNQGVKAIIDPNLFKKYNIIYVPTIVLEKSESHFDKVSGAVSIKYAIELFNNSK